MVVDGVDEILHCRLDLVRLPGEVAHVLDRVLDVLLHAWRWCPSRREVNGLEH